MTKAKIQSIIQAINKINIDNRRRPELARAASAEALGDFINENGHTKDSLIEKLQGKVDEDPNALKHAELIELIKAYV